MGVIVDYTSKDYDGFRTSMLDYATTAYPEWQPGSVADFGVMMVEVFAYMGDILSYYGDRLANEAFLATATQRRSILNIAEMLGYIPGDRTAGSGTVTLSNSDASPVVVPVGFQFLTNYVEALDGPLVFEVTEETSIPASGSASVPVAEGETRGTVPFTVIGESVLVVQLGSVSGAIDQEFLLPDCPVIDDSLRVFATSLVVGGDDVEEYTRYPHIIDAGPSDKAYEYRKDSKGKVTVRLGDGLNGVLPPTGTVVYAAYRVGGGPNGNISANAITTFGSAAGTLSITASSVMTGGADEETNDEIRTNAPLAYRTQRRAVTLEDYQDLALAVTGIGKASAVSNSFTSVTVYLLGTGGLAASLGLLSTTREFLNEYALAGTTVTTANATLVPINVGATGGNETVIGVDDRYIRANVQEAVNQALLTYLDPANRGFGERVSLSDIYSAIISVPGVAYATVKMLARDDAAQTGTNDVVTRAWEIPTAGTFEFSAVGGIA
jgi:uncharacterized phage protein gp47/JayE